MSSSSSTLRSISSQILALESTPPNNNNNNTNIELLATLKEQEKRRKASHRDPLKQRERQLRADATLKELYALRKEIMEELPDDDPLVKKIAASIQARQVARQPLEEALSNINASKMTCARAENILAQCQRELDSEDVLITKAKETLSARRKSHRQPLVAEVTAITNSRSHSSNFTVASLDALYQKLTAELVESDELCQKILAQKQKREASHRTPLIQEYGQFMRDPEKVTMNELNSFAAKCALELPPHDAIFGQIESLHEAKMNKDRKHTIDLDKIERGENGSIIKQQQHQPTNNNNTNTTDDNSDAHHNNNNAIKKKSSKKMPKEKSSSVSSSSKHHHKSNNNNGFSASSALSNVPLVPTIKGFVKDLDGSPPVEGRAFKLLMFSVFLVYCALMSYSSFLFLKVDKTSKLFSTGAVGLLSSSSDGGSSSSLSSSASLTSGGGGSSSVLHGEGKLSSTSSSLGGSSSSSSSGGGSLSSFGSSSTNSQNSGGNNNVGSSSSSSSSSSGSNSASSGDSSSSSGGGGDNNNNADSQGSSQDDGDDDGDDGDD
jgi:hypothetical protein